MRKRRAFYEYHAALMEPWDGPAAMAFTDGRQIGATLDRNGLRPARYIVTDDDLVIMASEAGVLPIPREQDRQEVAPAAGQDAADRPRAGPHHLRRGDQGRARQQHPYEEWLSADAAQARGSAAGEPRDLAPTNVLLDRQQAFGYTQEDTKFLMTPMATTGQEAIGSMGTDTPISALSDKSKLLYTYFKQNFAQVTNPPIDPIREELVMSLVSFIGPRPNLLDLEGTSRRKRLEVRQPILTNEDLEKIRSIGHTDNNPFRHQDARHHLSGDRRRRRHEAALERCAMRRGGGAAGYNIIILSDRMVGRPRRRSRRCWRRRRASSPDPQGPAHLGRPRRRDRRSARGPSLLLLAGYGAEAINPYLAFETLVDMHKRAEGDAGRSTRRESTATSRRSARAS
jgi:glutamate synthase (NADPH/NADH) large chain